MQKSIVAIFMKLVSEKPVEVQVGNGVFVANVGPPKLLLLDVSHINFHKTLSGAQLSFIYIVDLPL